MAFYVISAAMVAIALVLVLRPLLREGPHTVHPRSVLVVALVVALLLPLAVGGGYFLVGTPAALHGTTAPPASLNLAQALDELRAHLREKPDDLAGWMMLGQTSAMLHQNEAARDAFDHALKLAPNNADAMVGWAEADSQARTDHLIEGRAASLLERAVHLQPDSQRGLWLLGISHFQHARYHEAETVWRLLLPQLEPGSQVAKAVAGQIAVAAARAGEGTTAPASATSTASAPTSASLRVQVAIAPALRDKLKAGDVLFVYARAADTKPGAGKTPPLAVARIDHATLPTTVTLTDAMAMTAQHRLSSAGKVTVSARISHDGQPLAQAGDLEGHSGEIVMGTAAAAQVTLDTVH